MKILTENNILRKRAIKFIIVITNSETYFRVEVSLEHLANPVLDIKEENDVDVPLPTDQVSRL